MSTKHGMHLGLVSVLVFLGSILLLTPNASCQTFVDNHGRLKVAGNKIVDKNGQTVTLRGMAMYWSQWKPAFYNSNCIKWLRDDWKCTVIRISMAVGSGGYLTNPSGEMAKVKTVVQAAIDLGIYVVVDFHETGNGNTDIEASKKFFHDISSAYHAYPNLIYETWNEPLSTHSWATVIKPYHETIIPIIRVNDPDNIILCGTRSWSQEVDEASLDPITISNNIAYTLHFYAATHKTSYRTKAMTALKNGIALIATEGGLSTANGGGALDTLEASRWMDFLDQNGIAWMNWSVADLTESSAALKPGASANGNWLGSQLSESGTWVRERLRKMNGASVGTSLASPGTRRRILTGNGKVATSAMFLDLQRSHSQNLLGRVMQTRTRYGYANRTLLSSK
jgi:endoglucanase